MALNPTHTEQFSGARRYWLGVYYPTGYTIAVVDDLAEAQDCATALTDAGIPPTDVEVITGEEALDNHRRQRRQARLVGKVLGAVPTDEYNIQSNYLARASEGANFVGYRANDAAQEARARQILAAHHARHTRHFGRWMWEEAS